jgi:hypothetical protein
MARITKEVHSVEIDFAANGFVMNYSGRDDNDEWKSTKLVLVDFEELKEELKKAIEMSEYK